MLIKCSKTKILRQICWLLTFYLMQVNTKQLSLLFEAYWCYQDSVLYRTALSYLAKPFYVFFQCHSYSTGTNLFLVVHLLPALYLPMFDPPAQFTLSCFDTALTCYTDVVPINLIDVLNIYANVHIPDQITYRFGSSAYYLMSPTNHCFAEYIFFSPK